jgi:endonuclease/exonuclease/phosphatase family metal-dependent hydrolase
LRSAKLIIGIAIAREIEKMGSPLNKSVVFLVLGLLLIPLSAVLQIEVASFNIRYDNPRDPMKWEHRKDKVIEFIGQHDIIGLQEVLPTQLREIRNALPHMQSYGVGRIDGASQGELCPIFYDSKKYLLEAKKTKWLSKIPSEVGSVGWDAVLPRIATIAVLRDLSNENLILVVNTHFDHRGIEAREHSSDILLNSVELYEGTVDATIVMGDLNAEPWEHSYGKLYHSVLEDSYDVSEFRCPGLRGTYTGFTPGLLEPKRIDYVFVKDFRVLRYCHIEETYGNYYISDHLPVKVKLEYK